MSPCMSGKRKSRVRSSGCAGAAVAEMSAAQSSRAASINDLYMPDSSLRMRSVEDLENTADRIARLFLQRAHVSPDGFILSAPQDGFVRAAGWSSLLSA